MCKLAIITNLSKVKNISEFSEYMAEVLQDQKDGYGYAVLGEKGVFGARTLTPSYFTHTKFPSFCEVSSNTKLFGEVSKPVSYGMFHGRVSTNKVSLINTHPIEIDGNFVIHNGVVTNRGKKYKKLTTNDSEDVLHYFLKENNINQVAKNLTGYYAAGIISKDGLLHVFRDGIAPLVYAWSTKLDSHIFATNTSIIEMISQYVGEPLNTSSVNNDTYLCFRGNELIKQETFKSRGWDTASASHSKKSLGKQIHFPDKADHNEWDEHDMYGYNHSSGTAYNDIDDISDEMLDELEFMDDSYRFFSQDYSHEFTSAEFKSLTLSKQASCHIVRPDKTTVKTLKESYVKELDFYD